MDVKSIDDVAQEIDIAPTTIRKWDKDFNLNLKRNSKNNRIFTEDDILLIKRIKLLKNEGSGLNTITKKLNLHVADMLPLQDKTIDNKPLETEPEINTHATDIELYVNDMSVKFDKLSDRLEGILELSEKYSRACYEVGSLKAQLEGEQKEKVLLLKQAENKIESCSKDVNNLNKELTKKELDLEDLRKQNELLKLQLHEEKKTPWYKKLFGKNSY